ncbi:MAG: hypothetical protein L6461_09650 [Anaerolineae bacterium]|nr:hypothetical protein [Anaerolineae bacterium]
MRQGEPVQFHAANGNGRSDALLDVLQPGIVEEVIDRFALWDLLWLVWQNSLPKRAAWQRSVAASQISKLAMGVSTTPAPRSQFGNYSAL